MNSAPAAAAAATAARAAPAESNVAAIPGYAGVVMPSVPRCTCRCELGLAVDALSGQPLTVEEVGMLVAALSDKAPGAYTWYSEAETKIQDKKAKPDAEWDIGYLATCVMERRPLNSAQIVQVTLAMHRREIKTLEAFLKASATPAAVAASLASMTKRTKAAKTTKKKK